MIEFLPESLNVLFIITSMLAFSGVVALLFTTTNTRTQKFVTITNLVLLMWLVFQCTLALNGWYMDRKSIPPHLLFPVFINFILIGLLLFSKMGKRIVDGFSLKVLVWIHVIRIPVEIALWMLAEQKQVPISMTFEGRNFDIVMGLSAPLIFHFGYYKNVLPKSVLIAWNVIGIGLLLNIMITAAGAVPHEYAQMWDFDQPNYAIMHFPFILLPAFVAPLVLFSHFVLLRSLLKKPTSISSQA